MVHDDYERGYFPGWCLGSIGYHGDNGGYEYIFIYLLPFIFIFSSVQCSNAHTMYDQWATTPGRSLNYPRPKSVTHLRTFSDNGVYVAFMYMYMYMYTRLA